MSKLQTSFNNKYDRIVALIDMDCFYCQVEELLNPDLKGKPIAVVQYNAWRGGGIIAVNYPARAKGVTRHMRGDEAREQCPDIELVKVPNIREKADLSKYRNAGKQVAAVLQAFTHLLTRASIDEAYLDITEQVQNRLVEMNQGKFALQPNALKNTFVVGYQNIGEYVQEISDRITQPIDDDTDLVHVPEEDKKAYKKSDIKLLIASSIVSEIRAAVKEKTGYECSAGIAHNKVLAKLVCGLNKPNKQTIIPLKHISQLFSTLPIRKVQGLGGKFGERICEDLNIKFMGDLINFTKEDLQKRYDDKNGNWLYNIARGIDLEAVTPRLVSKSIGCCKKFPGRNAITAITTLNHWLHELAKEISERLEQDEEENNRRPKQMVISFIQSINNVDISSSRTVNLTTLDEERLVSDALDVLKKNTEKFFRSPDNPTVLNNPIKFLGLNVGKFENLDSKRENTIQNMFQRNLDSRKNETTVTTANDNKDIPDSESCDDKENQTSHDNISIGNDNGKKSSNSKISFFSSYGKARILEEAEKAAKDQETHASDVIEVVEKREDVNTFQNDMLMAELEANVQHNQVSSGSESPKPSTSSSLDYKQTYAEFYRPQSHSELSKVECEQCGKQIFEHELQIHSDAHLAFQLAQEQRTEFQNQLKRTIPQSTPAAKKMKIQTAPKTGLPSNTLSIQKFLVKAPPLEQLSNHSVGTEENIETEKCVECGRNIPIVELLEHTDYHTAKKLHEELLLAEMKAHRVDGIASKNSPNQNETSKKTKSQKRKTPISNSTKNIASFFQNA